MQMCEFVSVCSKTKYSKPCSSKSDRSCACTFYIMFFPVNALKLRYTWHEDMSDGDSMFRFGFA